MHQIVQHITRFFNVDVCSLQPNGSPRRFRSGRDGALRSLLQPSTRGIPLKEFLHGTEDPGQSTPGTYSRYAQYLNLNFLYKPRRCHRKAFKQSSLEYYPSMEIALGICDPT